MTDLVIGKTLNVPVPENGNRSSRTNGHSTKPRQSPKREFLSPALVLVLGQSPASIAAELRIKRRSSVPDAISDDTEKPSYRFNPLISPFENKSIVTLKGKVNRESKTFEVVYNSATLPNLRETKREEIKLPGISEEKVSRAKSIAQALKQNSKKITTSSRIKSIDVFLRAFEQEAKKINANEKDTELLTLSAYFCLESNGGFLSKLPDGLLSQNSEDLVERIRTLGKYFIVNLNNLDNPIKVERFEQWRTRLPEANLTKLYDFFSPADLLKICFPGYLDTRLERDFKYMPPVIREYLLPGSKWEKESDLLTVACQDIFFSQGVVGEHGLVDKEAVTKKDWSRIFRDKENGINGALGDGIYLHGAIDALDRATPGLFGIEEGQILPWELDFIFIIDDSEEGKKKLDQITKYLVEKKLKLVDEFDKVCVHKLREVLDWHMQYNAIKAECIPHSGLRNAEEALKRVYPDLFGWDENQIQPGEIKYANKWKGKEGKKLFALRFAKSIHTVFEQLKASKVEGFDNHGVIFLEKEKSPIYLPKDAFLKLKNYYIENNVTWWDHFLWFNLIGGFFTMGGNLEKAFTLLLGKTDAKTGCFKGSDLSLEDIRERNPFKASSAIELLAEIAIEYSGSSLRVDKQIIEKICEDEDKRLLLGKVCDLVESLSDEFSILETIITARPLGESSFVISDKDLRTLFWIFKRDIVPHIKANSIVGQQLSDSIQKILNAHLPLNSPRDLLAYTTATEREYNLGNNSLSLLNSLIEETLRNLMLLEEFRY